VAVPENMVSMFSVPLIVLLEPLNDKFKELLLKVVTLIISPEGSAVEPKRSLKIFVESTVPLRI
jgi:hypothetical protein